jgi:putative ABC transport system permease protein
LFRNYLVTALRNIGRHKLYAFINLCGLTVGLACVIFVLLFVQDELSYDTWLPGAQNLYRVEKTYYGLGRPPMPLAVVPFAVPAAMHDAIPEVTAMTRLNYTFMTLLAGDQQFREHVAEVDSNFFGIIRLPFVQGDPAMALRDPNSLVLSESAARKYFGTTDAMGMLLRTTPSCEMANDMAACSSRLVALKVTGIIRDIPGNSHLDGDVFMSNHSVADRQSWLGGAGFGYVVLAKGAAPEAVVTKLAPLLDHNVPGEPGEHAGSQRYVFHLTPFADVHLASAAWLYNEKPPGSRTTLYGVGIVGFLVLFLACFNFTNLSTARALFRAREVALRKVHGATRVQLIIQFLGEAVVTSLLSLVLALALVEVLQPLFGRLLQHPVALHYASDGPLLLVATGIAIGAGLLSGGYPALVLSSFRPVTAMRANSFGRAGSGRLRTILVVLQFAVSIGLGIAVLVVFSQISFARQLDLGFAKDNLLVVSGNGLLSLEGQESFVQQLRANPGILNVAVTDAVPFGSYSMGLTAAVAPGRSDAVALNRLIIGANTLQLLGVKLEAGRFLSDKRAQDRFDTKIPPAAPNDGHNILINRVAAANLGFTPQQAVGKTIAVGAAHVSIAGVVADVKFNGAREPAMAAMYVFDPHYPGSLVIRLRPGAQPQTLSFIDKAWHGFAPTKAISRSFLNDNYSNLYRADEQQGEIFAVFVAIAIFISALGLFGIAALTTGSRTKEIGIRKVFGARIFQIVWLLLTQFSAPVLLANLIAWPLAWYYLTHWLQGFAYRISLSPLYFVEVGLAALLIAWVTVFSHALRVARASPIHALRYE